MINIVLYISIHLFPWLHVLCKLNSINNDRKHAIIIIIIHIRVFGTLIFDGWSAKFLEKTSFTTLLNFNIFVTI